MHRSWIPTVHYLYHLLPAIRLPAAPPNPIPNQAKLWILLLLLRWLHQLLLPLLLLLPLPLLLLLLLLVHVLWLRRLRLRVLLLHLLHLCLQPAHFAYGSACSSPKVSHVGSSSRPPSTGVGGPLLQVLGGRPRPTMFPLTTRRCHRARPHTA